MLRQTISPFRRGALVLSWTIEHFDGALLQWHAAGISLLVIVILLGAAMQAAQSLD